MIPERFRLECDDGWLVLRGTMWYYEEEGETTRAWGPVSGKELAIVATLESATAELAELRRQVADHALFAAAFERLNRGDAPSSP